MPRPAPHPSRRNSPVVAMGLAAALLLAGGLHSRPALAQAASCPPPQKLAAGACVNQCPGGYEDRGRTCEYRNQSR